MKAITIALLVINLLVCQITLTQAQVDRYGGWTAIKAPATGFFYLTQFNGRDTFITPEGHAYYALGINHLSSSRSDRYSHLQDYQKDHSALKRIKDDLAYWNMNNASGDCPEVVKDQMPFFITISLTDNAHWLSADRFEFTVVFEQSYIEGSQWYGAENGKTGVNRGLKTFNLW